MYRAIESESHNTTAALKETQLFSYNNTTNHFQREQTTSL